MTMTDQTPLPLTTAWVSVARCVVASTRLLAERQVRLSRTHVGQRLRFTDGTSSRVYRETWSAGLHRRIQPFSWWAFDCAMCAGAATNCSGARVCSIPHSSSGFPASRPNCGWPMTNMASIEGSTNGTELNKPSTTRAHCGGSWL